MDFLRGPGLPDGAQRAPRPGSPMKSLGWTKLRALLSLPAIAVYTLVLGPPALLGSLLDGTGKLPHAIASWWSRLILRTLGVRVEVLGRENAPEGPALYAANHGSALDIPILFGHLPANFRVIHKRSLQLVPIIGWYLLVAGHIALDRRKPFRARKSLERAAARIRAGASLAVFPEGTRSMDSRVNRFKRGSFVLALNVGVPVVPVSLAGVKRLVPSGILTLRPGTVRLRLHPPVMTADRSVEEAETLAQEVREVVARGCEDLPGSQT